MNLKKKLLEKSRLYVIIDKKICGQRSLINIAQQIEKAGTDIIQFRDKESKKGVILEKAFALRKLLLNSKTIFIINDYLDVAKIIDSDGLHLGQDDVSIEIARKVLGKDKIIGISCHNLKQALEGQAKGADYIGIGPVFKTSTKLPNKNILGLDLMEELKKYINIPFFAIGGISENNIKQVLSSGINRVAICSAICRAKYVAAKAEHFSKLLH